MRKFDDKEWIDISNEEFREYVMNDGFEYEIEKPKKFFISDTGTHFVMDGEGTIHTIQRDKFHVLRFWSTAGLEFVEPSLKVAA